jgi:peptidoglycan/LPS O-acetylase OafA/YrhL
MSNANEFGPQNHPSQVMMLKIHGAAAMGFLIILGVVLRHIRPGWRRKQQRPSGLSLISVCGFLILSGWALYYVGDEQSRNWMSISHSLLGVLLPIFIFFHVWNVYQRLKVEKDPKSHS